MKRCLAVAVLLMLLTACNHEPPPYESHYVEPAPLSSTSPSLLPQLATPPLPPQASFVDEFNRTDTDLGLGGDWDMRGTPVVESPTLPPATDGFIREGSFTYAGTSSVAALRQFRGTVRGMGTIGQFRKIAPGLVQSGVTMNIIDSDRKDAPTLALFVARTGWSLRLRQLGKPFKTVAQGQFSPILDLDRSYRFEFQATHDEVTVTVPGLNEVTKTLSTDGLLSDLASWQEYPLRMPAAQVFDFDTVWAIEDGQPTVPVPLPNS